MKKFHDSIQSRNQYQMSCWYYKLSAENIVCKNSIPSWENVSSTTSALESGKKDDTEFDGWLLECGGESHPETGAGAFLGYAWTVIKGAGFPVEACNFMFTKFKIYK